MRLLYTTPAYLSLNPKDSSVETIILLGGLAKSRDHLVLIGTGHYPITHSYPNLPENLLNYDFL